MLFCFKPESSYRAAALGSAALRRAVLGREESRQQQAAGDAGTQLAAHLEKLRPAGILRGAARGGRPSVASAPGVRDPRRAPRPPRPPAPPPRAALPARQPRRAQVPPAPQRLRLSREQLRPQPGCERWRQGRRSRGWAAGHVTPGRGARAHPARWLRLEFSSRPEARQRVARARTASLGRPGTRRPTPASRARRGGLPPAYSRPLFIRTRVSPPRPVRGRKHPRKAWPPRPGGSAGGSFSLYTFSCAKRVN